MSMWPRPEIRIERRFTAWHSLPQAGNPDKHPHDYTVRFCAHSEINPFPGFGYAKAIEEWMKDADALIETLGDLDAALAPFPPTLEILCCWLLARLPAYWDAVEADAYGCLTVRIERRWLREQWSRAFVAGAYP